MAQSALARNYINERLLPQEREAGFFVYHFSISFSNCEVANIRFNWLHCPFVFAIPSNFCISAFKYFFAPAIINSHGKTANIFIQYYFEDIIFAIIIW